MKCRNDPSISAFKNKISWRTFKHFRVPEKDVVNEIKKLSTKKVVQSRDIPLKIIQENADIFWSHLCEPFNNCINKGVFPNILKHSNITLVFKRRYRESKENYRSMRIVPVASKIFEKLLYKQITLFMEQFLPKYQCSLR